MTTPWISGDVVQAWLGADKITIDAASDLAAVATDLAMNEINRDLSRVTGISEYYDTNGTDYILLNYWPVVSIGGVSIVGQTVLPNVPNGTPGWRLDPLNSRKLYLGRKYARCPQNVLVSNLSAGYDVTLPIGTKGALPGTVFHALRLIASAVFNSQAADPNLASESTVGAFSGTFYAAGVGTVPPGAASLLKNEMRVAP